MFHRKIYQKNMVRGGETKLLTGCTSCTQPVTTKKKEHSSFININLDVSPLGMLSFIWLAIRHTCFDPRDFFSKWWYKNTWKDHANPNELFYDKVKMESTVIFLCKYVVKKLAYKLRIFFRTKGFGMEHIITQITQQASKQKLSSVI